MIVPVVQLTRECQYVDEKWHRCGRLAYEYLAMWVRLSVQRSFRCREHSESISAGQSISNLDEWHYDYIDEDDTFGLGYEP